ncbi:MAG: C-type lectin domain-containing protein [Myxococcota bacterium]
MRVVNAIWPSVLLLPLVGACLSDFRSTVTLPQDCERLFFFEDKDGDGWGDPDGAYERACVENPDQNLTARNNLDCDDSDASVTGQTAALCPEQLVPGGAEYLAFAASGSEFAVVVPTDDFAHIGDGGVETTDVTWADGAASACGAVGWGGGLATFSDQGQLDDVTDQLDLIVGNNGYAGWVDLVPNDANDDWEWVGEEGEGLAVDDVGPCDADNFPEPQGDLDPGRRIALVKRPGNGSWCFGFPSDANHTPAVDGAVEYSTREAHFICERTPPLARSFNIDRDPASNAEE